MRFPEFEDVWNNIKLEDVLKIKSGRDQKNISVSNGKYNIYGSGGIIGKTNSYIYDKESVGIGRKGTIDKPFYFNEPFWTVDTLFYSEIKCCHPKFIFYLFQTINWYLFNQSTGIPSLTASVIENISKAIPNVLEQEKISYFLSLIDNRIETQKKIIEDYESLKETICNNIFKAQLGTKYPLSLILFERNIYSEKNNKYTHVTLSKDGIIPKTDRYNRDFLVRDENKEYKITKMNDLCYNPANLKFGVICKNNYGDAIFSPIYVTFEISKQHNADYVSMLLTNNTFIHKIRKYEQGTVYERMAVNPSDFLKGEIYLPNIEKQLDIIKKIKVINNKITIEKEILSLYKKQKQYLLNHMFI